jgi:hypothetical protein
MTTRLETIYGDQLEKVLRAIPAIDRTLVGIFAADDRLPDLYERPSCYVYNSDSSKEPGEHWTCAFGNTDGSWEYWDSYGLPPLENIYQQMKSTGPIVYNKYWLQDPLSNCCSLYVIYFLYARCNGRRLVSVLTDFKDLDFQRNDLLVNDFYKYLSTNYC